MRFTANSSSCISCKAALILASWVVLYAVAMRSLRVFRAAKTSIMGRPVGCGLARNHSIADRARPTLLQPASSDCRFAERRMRWGRRQAA